MEPTAKFLNLDQHWIGHVTNMAKIRPEEPDRKRVLLSAKRNCSNEENFFFLFCCIFEANRLALWNHLHVSSSLQFWAPPPNPCAGCPPAWQRPIPRALRTWCGQAGQASTVAHSHSLSYLLGGCPLLILHADLNGLKTDGKIPRSLGLFLSKTIHSSLPHVMV